VIKQFRLAAIAREINASGRPVAKPACIVCGGETTVALRRKGKGGRNQEIALAAAIEIAGMSEVVVLSGGTDGPTDAAGAIADGETIARALAKGIDARAYLANNDSDNFFQPLGDLLITGPTGTNVNAVTVVSMGGRSYPEGSAILRDSVLSRQQEIESE